MSVALAASVGCMRTPDPNRDLPTDVRVMLVGYDSAELTFVPPAGATAIEVVWRADAGNWWTIGTFAATTTRIVMNLPGAPAEGGAFEFRLRAHRDATPLPWSDPVSVRRDGIRPAWNVGVDAHRAAIAVTWTRGSVTADALRLERRAIRFDGAEGPWAEVPGVAVDAVAYADADTAAWADRGLVEYRVVYLRAGAESAPAMGRSVAAPPLAPANLSCSPVDESSIRLAWTPRSTAATSQVVVRAGSGFPQEVAVLSPGTSSWVDVPPAAGVWGYWISARAALGVASNEIADGEAATGWTARPDLPLAISAHALPDGWYVARDGQGRFATVGRASDAQEGIRVWREIATGAWEVHAWSSSTSAMFAPLLFGPGDRLHLLYGAAGQAGLRHEWLTDGGWSGEAVSADLPASAVVDAAGALHVASCAGGTVAYATDASGAWATETVPTAGAADACALAVSPAGGVWIAYTSPRPATNGGTPTASDLSLLTRDGAGWTEEALPVGSDGTAAAPALLRVFAGGGRTVVLYDVPGPLPGDVTATALVRDAGAWGAPAGLGVRYPGQLLSSARIEAAATSDASRVAVVWNGATTRVAILDAAGGWRTLEPFATSAALGIGFSPSGTLWVLDGIGPGALLYEEP